MIVFHIARDLEIFGVLPDGTTLTGAWAMFARLIAGSFFFFAGVSLVLGHGDGIRWSSFTRRLLMIGTAALLVSAATLAAMPSQFIYFGILHSIALCSIIGLAFLGFPASIAFLVSTVIFAVHLSDVHPLTSQIWSFTGLSRGVRPSLDLLPIVPWLSSFLLGIAVAKIGRPKASVPSSTQYVLGWLGRHSLIVYLVHQPILIGLIWFFLWVAF